MQEVHDPMTALGAFLPFAAIWPKVAQGRNRPFERVAQIARCSGHQSSTQVIVGRGAHVGLAEAISIVRDPAIYPFAESSRENTQKCGEPCYTA